MGYETLSVNSFRNAEPSGLAVARTVTHGPVVGAVTDTSACVLVRTSVAASIQLQP